MGQDQGRTGTERYTGRNPAGRNQKAEPETGRIDGRNRGKKHAADYPDFIIDTNDDGTITFSLNRGNIPQLTVSPSFTDMIDTYRKHKDKMSRSDKEALLYAKEKVDKAQDSSKPSSREDIPLSSP